MSSAVQNDNPTFNSRWNIWFHSDTADWSINGYKSMGSIENMQQFLEFHNNLGVIGNITNLHYFMMRGGITPIYEDPANIKGGRWSILVPLDKANDAWTELAKLVVGETFVDNALSINGITASVKTNVCVIQIWNDDVNRARTTIIPEYLFEQYKIVNSKILYTPHRKNY